MGRTQVFEWFSMLKTSVSCVEDVEPLGSQLTSTTGDNMDQVKDFVLKIRIMNISNTVNVIYFIWISFEYFEIQSEHASDCHQICALCAD
jgi:hypothetical protein